MLYPGQTTCYPTKDPCDRHSTLFSTTGPCTVSGNCVQSPNYPSNYGNSQQCTITVTSAFPKMLNVIAFYTEDGYDKVTIANKVYSGNDQPPAISLTKGDVIKWSSDNSETRSGWKMCLRNTHACSRCVQDSTCGWLPSLGLSSVDSAGGRCMSGTQREPLNDGTRLPGRSSNVWQFSQCDPCNQHASKSSCIEAGMAANRDYRLFNDDQGKYCGWCQGLSSTDPNAGVCSSGSPKGPAYFCPRWSWSTASCHDNQLILGSNHWSYCGDHWYGGDHPETYTTEDGKYCACKTGYQYFLHSRRRNGRCEKCALPGSPTKWQGSIKGRVPFGEGVCLHASDRNTRGGLVHMRSCDTNNMDQKWEYFVGTGQIKSKEGICLDASQRNTRGGLVHMWSCDTNNANQQWTYDVGTGKIKSKDGICLDANGMVQMWSCDNSGNQNWLIV